MIRQNQRILNSIQILIDLSLCFLSILIAYGLRFDGLAMDTLRTPFIEYVRLLFVVTPSYILIYNGFSLYQSHRTSSIFSEVQKIIKSNAVGLILWFILLFLIKEVQFSRSVLLLFAMINTLLCIVSRTAIRIVLRHYRKQGYNLRRILIVGSNEMALDYYKRITNNPSLGLEIMGFVASELKSFETHPIKFLGDLTQLEKSIQALSVDEAVVSIDYEEFPTLQYIIEVCEKTGIKVSIIPFYIKYIPATPYIDEVEGISLINIRKIPLDNLIAYLTKRSMDIVGASLGLLLCSPILLATAVDIKLTSPGNIIFKQTRIGYNRKPFTIYKFRSMRIDADQKVWSKEHDNRITKIGAFIRKCSIDELPQLWNVLKGDMSLVGPRPELPHFVDQFKENIPMYMIKHQVRPGITGWAQVNGWRGYFSGGAYQMRHRLYRALEYLL